MTTPITNDFDAPLENDVVQAELVEAEQMDEIPEDEMELGPPSLRMTDDFQIGGTDRHLLAVRGAVPNKSPPATTRSSELTLNSAPVR